VSIEVLTPDSGTVLVRDYCQDRGREKERGSFGEPVPDSSEDSFGEYYWDFQQVSPRVSFWDYPGDVVWVLFRSSRAGLFHPARLDSFGFCG
jgi:hypothetical protein